MSSKDIVANEGKIAFDSFKKLRLPLDRDQIRTLKERYPGMPAVMIGRGFLMYPYLADLSPTEHFRKQA